MDWVANKGRDGEPIFCVGLERDCLMDIRCLGKMDIPGLEFYLSFDGQLSVLFLWRIVSRLSKVVVFSCSMSGPKVCLGSNGYVSHTP
jgi:hypothetical protein